ncbi:hypothetical protein N9L07_03245 [Flavobacteriaceae bacterium]|nr:hypothetical protein [Flavobacteriaceae bacterium]MDC1056162.1 hypothetical protein [Flavobacteriaceae bacterium]
MKKLIFLILLLILTLACKTEVTKTLNQINPPKEVAAFFETYTKLWSEGNFGYIASDIYDLPITLYLQDNVHYLKSPDEVKNFLTNTFDNLEANHYGFSTINKWENYREDGKYIIVEMNFTRFLKDSTIMGNQFRKATYILIKKNKELRITAMMPHTIIDK